jgi:hypothetical protein
MRFEDVLLIVSRRLFLVRHSTLNTELSSCATVAPYACSRSLYFSEKENTLIQQVLKAVSTCTLNLHPTDIDTRNFIDTCQPFSVPYYALATLIHASTCLPRFCRTMYSVAQVCGVCTSDRRNQLAA